MRDSGSLLLLTFALAALSYSTCVICLTNYVNAVCFLETRGNHESRGFEKPRWVVSLGHIDLSFCSRVTVGQNAS